MEQKKEVILRAKDLHKAFYTPVKVPILKGVNLTISRGDTVAIMGRSGEGKSTLLSILGTLDKACQGTLEIVGVDVSPFNKAKMRSENIAFVFQSFHLLEDCTALENILMPARIARKPISKGSVAYQHAFELLEHVELTNRAHFHTKQLSGGEKQRVAIARALCNNPDIILADEPSGNLDHQTSQTIQDLLFHFARESNKSLIVVTHDQELANRCDQVYDLRDGQLLCKSS